MSNLPQVVYFVGPSSSAGYEDLRHSLRSLAANVPHASVAIAGHMPEWVTGVEHLPTEQTGDRWTNVVLNVLAAGAAYPSWLMMHDDFFVTRPVESVPVMRWGTCDQAAHWTRTSAKYSRRIRETGDWLRSKGLSDWCFDGIHSPQHIDSAAMRDALEICARTDLKMFQTLHGNLTGREATYTDNAKSEVGWESRTYVSTSDDRFMAGSVGRYLRNLFPEPCEYEVSP